MDGEKIDLFTHVLPQPYLDRLERVGGLPASLRGILQARSCLYDIDRRLRVMDAFPGYVQVLTLSVPPLEALAGPVVAADLARAANDSMAELVARHPDRFIGFVASLPLNDVDASLEETDRALTQLGALGVHICTNVGGLPLDDPRFEPLFARMAALRRPVWVHPYRTADLPDYPAEPSSRYGMWMAFGWPYETAVFMSRLILAGYVDRFPELRIVTHHGGGLVPQFGHRIGAGMGGDLPPVGASGELPPADQAELQRRVVQRYRHFYADTAVAATRHAMESTIAFFGVDRVVFATDMPFDPENGPAWIRDTLAELEAMDLTEVERGRILAGNARDLLGLRA